MSIDLGLLILRVVVGLLFIGHGTQKLFGWFGGYGFGATSSAFGSMMGLRPASFWTLMAGVSEAGGGLLLALGLLNPLGSIGITAAMLMAIVTMHWPRLWAANNGIELPLVYAVAATTVALAGTGAYALDAALGIQLPMPATWVAGLVLVVLGTVTALGTAQRPQPAVAAVPGEATSSQAA
ncbi:MAG: putative oxidoreductase [Chloroflexota bacterium]|jgi:putative oxidoreductase|nr:putative oxidoreductase [Chloroflexota bacterium]